MNQQDKINANFQECLADKEAQLNVLTALLVSMIETHPHSAALRRRFAFHAETIEASALNRAVPESYLTAMREFRDVLSQAFDRPRQSGG
jgi:hypothetical protein